MSPLISGILIGFLALALMAAGLLGAWMLWRLQTRGEQLTKDLATLESSSGTALAAIALLKQRIDHLEKRHQGLERRQDSQQRQLDEFASAQRAARPYDEAIRMVRQGASAKRLVDELGLSNSEAELLIMLHGPSSPHSAH